MRIALCRLSTALDRLPNSPMRLGRIPPPLYLGISANFAEKASIVAAVDKQTFFFRLGLFTKASHRTDGRTGTGPIKPIPSPNPYIPSPNANSHTWQYGFRQIPSHGEGNPVLFPSHSWRPLLISAQALESVVESHPSNPSMASTATMESDHRQAGPHKVTSHPCFCSHLSYMLLIVAQWWSKNYNP
jgi:hypothetical protein